MTGNSPINNSGGDYRIIAGRDLRGAYSQGSKHYNTSEQENLAEAAGEIQQLLNQFEQLHPTFTTAEKIAVATEVIQHIESNPTLKARLLNVLEVSGIQALEQALNHPTASFVIAALQGWQKLDDPKYSSSSDIELGFLAEILQAIQDSDGNAQELYPILESNLDKLDDTLTQQLHIWAITIIPKLTRNEVQCTAANIANFSTIIRQFPLGNKDCNIEIAIVGYEIVAQVFTREAFPEQWAMLRNNLGVAYLDRIRGIKAENIELAIACFQAALAVYTRETFPTDWAKIQNNLGTAYSNRIWGERAENLEQTITCFQAALQVYTRESSPREWAETLINLGNTYQALEQYQQALAYYQQSLQVIQEIGDRYSQARIYSQLGNINHALQDYEVAQHNYQQALQICIEHGERYLQADIYYQLGLVAQDLRDFGKARYSYRQALEIFTEFNDRLKQGKTLEQFGDVYINLGKYSEALDYHQQALSIFREIGENQGEATSLASLGRVYQSLGQHNRAIDNYQQALAVTEKLGDAGNRNKVLIELIQLCTHLGEFAQALVVSEGIDNEYQRTEVMSYITQDLLQIENYDQALATAQAIPDKQKRLEVLTRVVEVVSRLEDDRADKLLTLLHNDSDERVCQLVRLYIREPATPVASNKSIWKYVQTFIGHSDLVRSVAISPDGQILASSSVDKTIKLWNLETGELLYTLEGHSSAVISVAFSPDGTTLASASNLAVGDGNIKLWNVETGTLQQSLGKGLLSFRVSCVTFSPDGQALASGNIDATIKLWQLNSGKVHSTLKGHGWDVNSVAFSRDGQILVSGSLDGAIKIWNWRTRELLHTLNRPSPSDLIGSWVSWFDSSVGAIWSVAISPDGQMIASGGSDQPIMLWNAGTGKLVRTLTEHSGTVFCVTFSPNGKLLASGGDDNTLRIWNYQTGELLQTLRHLGPVHCVAFRSDSQTLVSGSADTTIKVWSSTRRKLVLLSTAIRRYVSLSVSPKRVQVGRVSEVSVRLSDSENGDNSYLLEFPRNEAMGGELNIILNASGFQFDGDNTASLPLDLKAGSEISFQLPIQTAHFRLTALRPGTATITAELYRGDTFETNLEAKVQVTGFDEASFIPKRLTTQPRPVPQPNFILRVQTVWNETNSACRFHYQLRSFRLPSLFPGETNYHSETLSSNWIGQMRGLLGTTLENLSDALPEDGRSHLTSLGQYLFQHLLPRELQTDFRSLIPRERTFTLLILADQDASLPWELLHDGQQFLSDRFIIGRWFWELNDTRPHEFPVGAINVAHYADVEQPELWAALLEPPGASPPLPLPEGVLSNLDSTEAMRGLHLIRYSQSSDATNRRNAPVTLDDTNNAQDIERQMRPAKLNLRRNRPLVSLGYVRRSLPELTTLEQTWASAFICAGCSAFTGSLWAVDPAVEAAFISGFYNRLWTGDSLGEAFHASRQLARAVAPDSLDWLAYVLFGDPMARPYRPVEGKGYAVVEPIGREIDEPLPPGVPVRFRLSLRRTPPVWHEERVIEVAENLTFENLQAHVKTFGLQVTPDSVIAMSLAPTGNYLGWFTLVAPPEMVGNSALVQVFLMDGMQPIHSLMFSLNIENEGS
ncbi:tetratricopeptide repeat protein [Leptolyngbya sp. FACHB-671]|uniref:tetratricopeptide repeat protein n=1 Tax=Leptolyngbya sp. FACHB-671 TaxID=2692812 RepID=UPI001684B5F6|nr:tetratricopeptide repeat protein [Leptolyngbya sp. FACHB-671]MBD2065985.1 tetratricopeptide repeat protein [Leptolyngbya sp. FACHB-671]